MGRKRGWVGKGDWKWERGLEMGKGIGGYAARYSPSQWAEAGKLVPAELALRLQGIGRERTTELSGRRQFLLLG
jgi:hypothetical protein